MKTVVTHQSPDLDALTATWLIRRFRKGWKDADVQFVSAGETLNSEPADENPDIAHVDTGFGQFDHHQTADKTCAALLVLEKLTKDGDIKDVDAAALDRLVDVVNRYDHFLEANIDNPSDDIHDFSINYALGGVRLKVQSDKEVLTIAELILDGVFVHFKNKINAEKDIERGYVAQTKWGKTLFLVSENDTTMKVSFKMGYDMTIRKSQMYGYVRIKLHPSTELNLDDFYEAVQKKDPQAAWFYHSSGKMLLNNSSKARGTTPSRLSIKELVKIAQSL